MKVLEREDNVVRWAAGGVVRVVSDGGDAEVEELDASLASFSSVFCFVLSSFISAAASFPSSSASSSSEQSNSESPISSSDRKVADVVEVA